MDNYDYRPYALVGILFLLLIVISSALGISRRKITFLHVGQVIGWAITALFFFFGLVGSAPPHTSWIGLALFSALLFFWLRFGLRALKAMNPSPQQPAGTQSFVQVHDRQVKAMALKFINRHGREQSAESLAQLIAAVRDGELSSDTLVFNEQEQRWQRASELVEVTGHASEVALPQPEEPQVAQDAPKPAEAAPAPNVEAKGGAGRRILSVISRWTSNGPMVYCFCIGLGYALVRSLSSLVRDEYLTLAVDLLGLVGVVMGLRGLFRRKKTVARWERVVAGCLLLSVAVIPLAVTYKARRQQDLVKLTHSRLQDLTKTFDAEVTAAGIPAVFQMLSGESGFDESKIRETRTHMGDLIAALEQTATTAKGYIQECRDELSPTDPNSVFLKHLSDSLTSMSSVKRDYFLEIGRLLDFLTSSKGKYTATKQGLLFHTQKDADTYNSSVARTVKYEEQLAAIASEMRTGSAGRIVPQTCTDPHERVGQTGVCWCEPGYTRDPTSLKCVN